MRCIWVFVLDVHESEKIYTMQSVYLPNRAKGGIGVRASSTKVVSSLARSLVLLSGRVTPPDSSVLACAILCVARTKLYARRARAAGVHVPQLLFVCRRE